MNVDVFLFHWVNDLAGIGGALDAFGIFAAVLLLPILGFLMLPAAFSSKVSEGEPWWKFLAHAALAAGLAYALVRIVGALMFRPRPFVSLPGIKQLVAMSPDISSFPSGHASVAFALAFAAWYADRVWGWVFFGIAAAISAGRVFVGVHFPLDILGGFLVGWFAAWLMQWVEKGEWRRVGRVLR